MINLLQESWNGTFGSISHCKRNHVNDYKCPEEDAGATMRLNECTDNGMGLKSTLFNKHNYVAEDQ